MKDIIVKVEGGLVTEVENIPDGWAVVVQDFDTDDADPESDALSKDGHGNYYRVQVFTPPKWTA